MRVCTRCLYGYNHPFGITFNENGVCSGCLIHEEKDTLNWDDREDNLKDILLSYKNNANTNYDCIIPVSGGKDSYFIVDTIKNKYKMNPLLVSYNSHYNTLVGLRNLQNLKTVFGCDLVQLNINPNNTKKIAQYTFKKFGSMYWHNHAGSTVFPIQIAVKFKIPLIIWGLHQGVDQVGMFSHTDEVEMTRKYRKEHDLIGIEPEDLYKEIPNELKIELKKYFYPTDNEIKDIGIRGIYLNNFIRWDSKKQHEQMIEKYNFQTLYQDRTFNSYEDTHSLLYNDVHDYIKFIKFGYSKVLDHACQEIRLKRLSRESAIKLVNKYQSKKIKYLNIFLKWIEMSEKDFYSILSNFRDKRFFDENLNLLESIIDYKINKIAIDNNKLNIINEDNKFIVNSKEEDIPDIHSFYKGIYL